MHRVHPRLRPFVAAAVGYRHEGMPPGEHLGLPSPFLTFVVPFDEPLEMAAHPDPAQAPGRYDGLVGGLHTRPARIAHPGRQDVGLPRAGRQPHPGELLEHRVHHGVPQHPVALQPVRAQHTVQPSTEALDRCPGLLIGPARLITHAPAPELLERVRGGALALGHHNIHQPQ